jgi:hypothetical protein
MKEPTRELVAIFKPIEIGYDWMDWEIGKKKELTFHHIIEARNGGKCTLRNGAILTRQAHDYLNYLDCREHKLYQELNGLFAELNKTMQPPEDDYYEELNGIYVKRLLYIPTRGKHGIYEE